MELIINYDHGNMTMVTLVQEAAMKFTTQTVSKAQFKPHALEYLRRVEKDKQPLTITHAGKPVVQIVPFAAKNTDDEILQSLRGSVLKYDEPTEPVGLEDWELLK